MTLHYTSTRGQAPELDFGDVLLTGLAADGGLYCPIEVPPLPELPPTSADGEGPGYAELAARRLVL